MNCPYCSTLMEQGLIASAQELSWKSGSKRPFLNRADLFADSVLLAQHSFFRGAAVTAYLCRNCQKVVIDYSEAESDWNNR